MGALQMRESLARLSRSPIRRPGMCEAKTCKHFRRAIVALRCVTRQFDLCHKCAMILVSDECGSRPRSERHLITKARRMLE